MTKCPICFKKADYTTACNHAFCKKCLHKWKNSCPLCRRMVILQYPNTRAMATKRQVMKIASRFLATIEQTEKAVDKLKIAEKLFNHIWDNRIVIRKDQYLCGIIHRKSILMETQCRRMEVFVPKILKKTSTI